MKNLKKLLAYVLSVTMLAGVLPVSVNAMESTEISTAAETGSEVVDAAIIFSDLHTRSKNYKDDVIKEVFSTLKNAADDLGVKYSSVTSGGDAFSVNKDSSSSSGPYTGYTATINDSIRTALGDKEIPVNYVWSDHDRYALAEDGSDLDKTSYFSYGAGADGVLGTDDDGNYYIYSLSMGDLSSFDRYDAGFGSDRDGFSASVEGAVADFTEEAEKLHKDRPLLVVSHQPLFDRRDDNAFAELWFDAINAVAEEMDVAFFFGHNHKYDEDGDYYYAKGSQMDVATTDKWTSYRVGKDTSNVDLSTRTKTLNFTHMCAGYLDPATTDSVSDTTREGTAIAVTIYEDHINYTAYDADGVYDTNSKYALNVDVARDHAADALEEKEQTVTYADHILTIQATAPGLTAIDAENVTGEPELSDYFTDYISYDVELTGQEAGNEIFYSILFLDDMDDSNVELYHVDENGSLTFVPYEMVTDEQGGRYLEFRTTYTGTFVYGAAKVPEGYTLSRLEVSNVVKTNYLVGENLDLVSPEVKAVYVKEGSEDFTRMIAIADGYVVEDGYTVSGFDMTAAGKQTVVISYEGLTASFEIEVFEKVFTDADTGINVEVSVPGTVEIHVETMDANDEVVAAAVADILESYVAYDIDLTGYVQGEKVTVTLPVPEGVTNPKVYYVSDDGSTVTNMHGVQSEDGRTVSFETDHFSQYVVGDGVGIEVEEPKTAAGKGTITTTVSETVYVLATELEAGKSYLIANGTSGTVNLLGKNGTSISSVSATTQTDNVNGENKTFIKLEDAANVLWKVDGSYTFKNGEQYLGYSSSTSIGQTTYTLGLSDSEITWSYGSNQKMSTSISNGWFGSTSYYLNYSQNWSMTTTNNTNNVSSISFYEPTERIVETSVTVDGIYSIAGTPEEIQTLAISGNTVDLGSTLTFTSKEGSSSQDVSETAAYTVYADENGVISLNGNTVTLTGHTGTAIVKVSYAGTDDAVNAYEVDNYIEITATEPIYDVRIEAVESSQLKVGSSVTLSAFATLNGDRFEAEAGKITWSSSDETIATVDPETGVLAAKETEGDVIITATYKDPKGNEHHANIQLVVVGAEYELVLHHVKITIDPETEAVIAYELGEEITKPIPIKDVEGGQKYTNIWAVIYKDGEDMGQLTAEQLEKLSFISSDETIATVKPQTGEVTFTGNPGVVTITATYAYADGRSEVDSVTFTVSDEHYYIPEDGTDDFPEYPKEGSVRLDKTATAVGNFSDTGIAKVELSMTGVPYSSVQPIDVVLMLDNSTSMDKNNRVALTKEAAETFIRNIVKVGDKFTGNRIYVASFEGGNERYLNKNNYQTQADSLVTPYTVTEEEIYTFEYETYDTSQKKLVQQTTVHGYQVIDSDEELEVLLTAIDDHYGLNSTKADDDTTRHNGTDYSLSLKDCYNLLEASKTEGRMQFCVFMSDGIPNRYQGETDLFRSTDASQSSSYNSLTPDIDSMFEFNNGGVGSNNVQVNRDETSGSNDAQNGKDVLYQYEQYSTLMKESGVTVYTVGLGLNAENSGAWSSASAASCLQVAKILLNDISGPAGETKADRDTGDVVSKEGKYFFNVDDAESATELTNVFSYIAQQIQEAARDVKVVDEITPDYTMVFDFPNAKVEEALTGSNGEKQEFYIEVNEYALLPKLEGNTIVDYERGTGVSLMKMYLSETVDLTGAVNGYQAAKDADGTPYDAPVFKAEPLGSRYYWTTDSTKGDCGISVNVTENNQTVTYYFISTGAGTHNMVSGGFATGTPTETTIVHKNEDGTETTSQNTTCEDLILATPYFVYNASTKIIVWTTEKLSSTELALSYFLYLENSGGYVGAEDEKEEGIYDTNVHADLTYTNFKDNECEQIFPVPKMAWNGAQVSYVFYLVNEDGVPVNRAGRQIPFSEAVYVTDVYTQSVIWNAETAEGERKLESRLLAEDLVPSVYELYDETACYEIYVYETEEGTEIRNHFTIAGNKTPDTTYVYNTKAEKDKYTANGTYYRANVHEGFDFSNTTVAFAVVWRPELVEDVVVIDYGLPVDINVAANDNVAGRVSGLSDAGSGQLADYEMNKGQLSSKLMFGQELSPTAHSRLRYGKAQLINETTVRYIPQTMSMPDTDVFYYVTSLNYYDSSDTLITSRMYSSVTVVPAANIYYEDTTVFVNYTDGKSAEESTLGKWSVDGTEDHASTQAQDRPGADKISASLDADNIYGYDNAYTSSSKHSLGSAHKVTVSAAQNPSKGGQWPTASFTFTGTAFDIISLTSSQTGTITVKVENEDQTYSKNWIVDTYYGYTYQTDETNPFMKYTFVYGEDGKWYVDESKTMAVKEKILAAGETDQMPAEPKEEDSFVTFEHNGTWIATEDAENALYQIPVIKSPELAYDTYNVTITVRYSDGFNHSPAEGDNSYDFYLDGVRIYNPAYNNEIVNNVYVQDGEAFPVYAEIRKNLLNQKDTENDVIQGAVFIDGFGASANASDYSSYGPNNEVYLNPGQAVAFRISDENYANYAGAHLGVKAPNGGAAKVTVAGAKTVEVTTESATERYYDVTDSVAFTAGTSGLITITNTGDSLVSLTNLKVTHNAPGTSQAVAFFMTKQDVAGAAALVYDQYLASVPVEKPTVEAVKKLVTEVFGDVMDDWYTDYVQFVYDHEIMFGNDNTFTPNRTLTRAMVVTTLYRMAGSPKVKDTAACQEMTDVSYDQWYTDAICWAYKEGITTGYTGRQLFGVNDPVTREQLAAFFYRYAQYKSLDVTSSGDLSEMKNCDQVSDYAKEAVTWIVGTGVIRGVEKVENGKTVYDLAPSQHATRAQMAAMLTRFCEFYEP